MSQNNPQVLFIVGPTSTGKTSLALKLAKQLGGDLISADSRQVYKGLDVLTGKDIPKGFKLNDGVYTDGDTSMYGLDLIEPTGQWSAGFFQTYAKDAIEKIVQKKRLPIVVGGTGFYIQSLLTGKLPASAPSDSKFRVKLETESLEYLQEQLKKSDPIRWDSMNHSDQNNKRRLIRALEINFYTKLFGLSQKTQLQSPQFDSLVVGLKAPLATIEQNIATRVQKRLDQNVQKELALLTGDQKNNLQSYSTLGYKQLDDYEQKIITKDELLKEWITKERQYAKRQITWFKKQPDIHWFDVTSPNYDKKVAAEVADWYIQTQ